MSRSVATTTNTVTLNLNKPLHVVLGATGLALAATGLYSLSKFVYSSYFKDKREEGRPQKLLHYVFENAKEGDVSSVIDTIDHFCGAMGEWMMNVGDVKGEILDAEVKKKQPKIVVELGGYCGYSALRIARLLPKDGHLYSIEISPYHAAIATKILEFAGMKNKVTVVVGTVDTKLAALRTQYHISQIDLLFVDHIKTGYKPDVIKIDADGLLKSGSVIVADNILYPGAPDYLAYMEANPEYVSVCYDTDLEYSKNKDMILVSVRK